MCPRDRLSRILLKGEHLSDDVKFLLGPALALVPILAWELWLKPLRVRRNLALSILAEVDINLHWLLAFAAYRAERADALMSRPMARKLIVESRAHELGEFPPELVGSVLRFYANVDAIVAINNGVREDRAASAAATDNMHRRRLSADIARGHESLSLFIPKTAENGELLRASLYTLAVSLSFAEDLAPLRSMDALRAAAARVDPSQPGMSRV